MRLTKKLMDCKMKVFARLFQKAAGCRGRAPARSPQGAKFPCAKRRGKGAKRPGGAFAAGNPRMGFPDDPKGHMFLGIR